MNKDLEQSKNFETRMEDYYTYFGAELLSIISVIASGTPAVVKLIEYLYVWSGLVTATSYGEVQRILANMEAREPQLYLLLAIFGFAGLASPLLLGQSSEKNSVASTRRLVKHVQSVVGPDEIPIPDEMNKLARLGVLWQRIGDNNLIKLLSYLHKDSLES